MTTTGRSRELAEMRSLIRTVAELRERVAAAKAPRGTAPDAKPRRSSRGPGACTNASVYLTCANEQAGGVACFPTSDPFDRAHASFDPAGMLLPAIAVRGKCAVPRRYPRCQLTSAGVSIDSAFDEHEARLRLLKSWELRVDAALPLADQRDLVPRGIGQLIDRNKRAFQVASVSRLARRYLAEGLITEAEAQRLQRGEPAPRIPG